MTHQQPQLRAKTPAMVWVVLILVIALAGLFVWWTTHDQHYLAARRGISDTKNADTQFDLEQLRDGLCQVVDVPGAQRVPSIVALEQRVWKVYGVPASTLCTAIAPTS